MASGRPILAYAPPDLASSGYIESYRVGLVSNTREQLRDHMFHLLTNTALRDEYGQRAFEIAQLNHSDAVVEQRIYEVIVQNWLS